MVYKDSNHTPYLTIFQTADLFGKSKERIRNVMRDRPNDFRYIRLRKVYGGNIMKVPCRDRFIKSYVAKPRQSGFIVLIYQDAIDKLAVIFKQETTILRDL